MKTLITSIDVPSVQKLLHFLKAVQVHEQEIVMEYFDSKAKPEFPWVMTNVPYEFHKLFRTLEQYVTKGSLESQGLYLTLIDKNEDCFIVLHQVHPKNKEPLLPRSSVQFHLYEWANIEELLLEYGFELVCTVEEKRITYQIKKFQAECIVVIPPNSPAYLELKTEKEEQMIKILAELGYSLDQTQYIER